MSENAFRSTGHVVLLGDSIFDNAAYVAGAPDVVRQLRAVLPHGWRATLLAVDGAVTSSVGRQLGSIPPDASLVVISVGGNDALGESSLLRDSVRTVGEAVMRLSQAQASFAADYEAMLEAVLAAQVSTALCTIYDCDFPPPEDRLIRSALSLFNDVITRAAFARGLPLVDLRLTCNEADDYANPIEPSEQGGAKIAAAIAALATGAASGSLVVR